MDIRALHRQGLTYAEIGRLVGRDWRTVKRYLTTGAQPVYRRKRTPSKLDPHKPRIDQWLAKTPTLDATRIHQDLVRDFGFEGSYQTVRRYVERARPAPEPDYEGDRPSQGVGTAPETGGRRAPGSRQGQALWTRVGGPARYFTRRVPGTRYRPKGRVPQYHWSVSGGIGSPGTTPSSLGKRDCAIGDTGRTGRGYRYGHPSVGQGRVPPLRRPVSKTKPSRYLKRGSFSLAREVVGALYTCSAHEDGPRHHPLLGLAARTSERTATAALKTTEYAGPPVSYRFAAFPDSALGAGFRHVPGHRNRGPRTRP